MPRRRDLLAFIAAAPLLRPEPSTAAAPKAELWSRWQVHDPLSTQRIDHAAWGAFLARYVHAQPDGLHVVDYGAVDAADRAALAAYLDALAAVPISACARPDQMAFWINLYNALTIKVVLDHYPVRSIRDIDISPGVLADGPWGAKLLAVEGEELSLDDIEHRILRPIWGDPRVHYAVNCAARGCPNLAREPYLANRLDGQFDAAAFAFVNHPRGARLEDDRLIVSSIYHWYKEDFGGSDRGVVRHLCAYAVPSLAMQMQHIQRIAAHAYDWALNEAT